VDTINDKPGVLIASASEVMAMEDAFLKEREELEKEIDHERLQSSLTSHIMSVFQRNKDARQTSGIEEKLLQSLRAYNGRYDPEDLSKIKATGGSQIYMNLTPTKCRAAMSWIRDILMSAKEKAWSFSPTTVPDLPEEVSSTIRQRIEQMASELKKSGDGSLEGAAAGVQELNQLRIDIEEAIADEIYKLAETEVKKFEDIVADQLDEGDWEEALSEFIEDFCVFQAAIMKGPIITKKKKMTWDKGKPLVSEEYCYLNRRVAPLDIYPSPSATKIDEGDLCEHIRLSRKDLYGLIGVEGYSEEYIRELLDNTPLGNSPDLLDSEIEEEKAIEEYRGDTYAANRDVYHGIHFFGSAPHSLLSDWGVPNSEIGEDTNKEFEVEAILVGDRVIKCMINDDPLLRRPYYKACFQNIPGSWWGRSLPELMRDIQRICNATARALSNNMGIAAGPQVEVYIDRLAADEELESIYPFKMWQVTTDPTGAGGRAVQFWQPSSNASELLAVYKEFELRADDATSIPRYAYGNDRSLADYERVWTPTGAVPISELIVGDAVCNTYGGTSSVLGVYPQGEQDIFSVKFSNNTSVDCTIDHLWDVATNDKFSTKSLEDILTEGIFRCDNGKWRPKFKIPQTSCICYEEKSIPVDPYTMGLWLGDGTKGSGVISGIDLEVFDNIPYEVKHYPDNVHHNLLGLITDLKKTNVWDKGSFDKFIPEDYLLNSEDVRLNLLRGLMDTDGCCSENGRLIYTTSSEKLRDNFIQLVKSLGGTSQGYSVNNNKDGYKPSYKITFQYNNLDVHLFNIKRKEERRVAKTRYINTYISGIEYKGTHTATCIRVDSSDHLYVCENFIPTHNTAGAAGTASGLSMLLESASKGIKDAIRHIDDGLIKPRVEYQFYWNMITNQDLQFSGDIQVIAKGSQALTMKGAQEMRRNEFLQILGNQTYLQIVGVEGLAEILREMAASLGLGTNIVPSRIELKRKLKQQEAQQQQQVQAEQQNKQAQTSAGVQQVQMQVEQAEMASQRNALLKEKELQQKAEIEFSKMQLKLKELEQKLQEVVSKSTTTLSKAQIDAAQKDRSDNKNIALSVQSGYQDENNQQ